MKSDDKRTKRQHILASTYFFCSEKSGLRSGILEVMHSMDQMASGLCIHIFLHCQQGYKLSRILLRTYITAHFSVEKTDILDFVSDLSVLCGPILSAIYGASLLVSIMFYLITPTHHCNLLAANDRYTGRDVSFRAKLHGLNRILISRTCSSCWPLAVIRRTDPGSWHCH